MEQRSFLRETFTHRVLIATGITGAVIILAIFFWHFAYIFLLVFAGILFGVFLRGLAEWVSAHTPLPVGWSLFLVILFLIEFIALSVSLLGPSIIDSFNHLTQILPQALDHIQEFINKRGMKNWLGHLLQSSKETFFTQEMFTRIAGIFSNIIGAITGIVIILVDGLYFSAQPEIYTRNVMRLTPQSKHERAQAVLSETGRALRWWMIGTIIAMVAVGVMTWIGLLLLGIPAAAALAFLAMMLTFISIIGPILSAGPAILAGWMQGGFMMAVYVTLLYFVVHTIEGYLMTPLIQERAVYLPPAILLTALLIMGFAFGILGLLLAAPLTVVAQTLVKMLYMEDTLGERVNLV
jgi:predicted PurR-regulated permease PerM